VKTDNPEKSSIYQGEKTPPTRRPWGVLLLFALLLALLLSIHFLNWFMQWTMIRQELAQGPAFHSPEYTFLGFSEFSREKVGAIRLLPNAAPYGRVFGFFDLLHPAVFLVWNNGRGDDFVDLGRVIVSLPAGFSRVSFYPGSVFKLGHGNQSTIKYFGGAIIGRAWLHFIRGQVKGKGRDSGQLPGSFVVKQAEGSRYLKVPYLVYFFLPLALIIAAISMSGSAVSAAFFYYVEMFFLFDHQQLFVSVPLGWIFRALDVELSDFLASSLAVLLAVFFLACAVYGLWHWKKRETPPWQKWTVLFFVLLPVFLFF